MLHFIKLWRRGRSDALSETVWKEPAELGGDTHPGAVQCVSSWRRPPASPRSLGGAGGTAPRSPSSRVFAGVLPALVTAQALRPEGSPLPVEWGHVKMWGGTGPSD